MIVRWRCLSGSVRNTTIVTAQIAKHNRSMMRMSTQSKTPEQAEHEQLKERGQRNVNQFTAENVAETQKLGRQIESLGDAVVVQNAATGDVAVR